MEVHSFETSQKLQNHVTEMMHDAHGMGIFLQRNKSGRYTFVGRFGEHFDHHLKVIFRSNKGMQLDLNACIEKSGIRLFYLNNNLPY